MTLQAEGRKVVNVGNYRLTGKRLGKGNFARVEEAVHSVLNTKVALKIMDVTLIKEDYVIRNLYREARIMSRLFHPCIAALFQTMQFGNLYYLVMELVGGGDLCTFIKAQRNGKLDERCTRVYARQLVSAISHMHNLGIVHRDLKMENVMLNSLHTQIKIVDFGLSNTYTENNPLRTHCGSPEYAAPELFMEGKQYGPEVDLWSLGVILYGMVIGQLPFVTVRETNMTSQERRKKLLEQINKGIAAPHRRALAIFSPDFRTMIAKLLVADSTKRITVKELIFHPWITEKGKKSVRTNPLKKLDGQYQAIIMKDVSSLLHLNLSEVDFAVKSEPQGNVSGIYNILAFKQTLHQLEGDGITRNIPDQAINYLVTPRARLPTSKETKQAEVKVPKRKELMKSAPLPKSIQLKVAKGASVTPKTERPIALPPVDEKIHKKKVIAKGILSRWEKMTTPRAPPASDQCMGEPPRRQIMSAEDHKRPKLLEKAIDPMHAGNGEGSHLPKMLSSPKPSSTKSTIIHSAKERKSSTKTIESIASDRTKGPDTRAVRVRMTDKLKPKELSLRIQSANAETIKTDISDRLRTVINHTRRPLTGPMHTAERAMKRRSVLPATASTNSQSKGASNTSVATTTHHGSAGQPRTALPNKALSLPTTASSVSQRHHHTYQQHHQQQQQRLPQQIHRDRQLDRPEEEADVLTKRFVSTPTNNVRAFLNEPIARSIAGYVVNNIPNKLQTFKWVKAAKKEGL